MVKSRKSLSSLALAAALLAPTFAAAETPLHDVKGSKDSPIVSRFGGATIIGYQKQDYAALTLPLGPYDADQKSRFAKSTVVEGRLTKIVYAIPEGKTALEVYRNYEQSLMAAGFKTAYRCEGEACGGYNFATAVADPVNQAMSGENSSLRIDLLSATNGNVRAMTARLDRPEGAVHVSLLVSQDDGRQPGVLLQIVEGRPMQTGQVTVNAKAIGDSLADTGHVALYGIQFKSDSAVLTATSDETLAEMAKFLKQDTARSVYVVGHTDNVGELDRNIELSQARALAVVKALTGRFGVTPSQLQPKGVGPYVPVASNATDTGRSRNRRVELVER
ncbi:OmpA family protein [Allorhizobium taibaishanense]|uniref:Cell envelope biogenesis protein OmpA n=1 Tax=Allorhizobium taibaishanense TaxID=887144 RepID=A0A1Q9AB05_9HYPH|nr:OmpA family protein [Allorhizobium taibaishanense]MBB4010417.1 outer membrane protein OmpA-like peptidoglycan-associated protein [Allorhizobium taibaishanense]OLP52004.1 cell envelope biogenesis protein OmpA [Allorhizobium taibaishanense]